MDSLLASNLNLSIEYYSVRYTAYHDNFHVLVPKHYSAIVVLGYTDYYFYLDLMKNTDSFYSRLLVDNVVQKFMYCAKNDEREGFDAGFWATPLDQWSWIFLGITCTVLLIQVRGDWFQIYSILMRQSCTLLQQNRTLIVFIFASIVFTYGYEGVISSLITVLPPFKTFKTIKELVDNGYKIIMDDMGFKTKELLRREGINSSFESLIIHDSTTWDRLKAYRALSFCNTTVRQSIDSLDMDIQMLREWQDQYNLRSGTCHVVSETEWRLPKWFIVYGALRFEFGKMMAHFFAAGLPSVFSNYENYITQIEFRKRRDSWMIKHSVWDETTVAFSLKDWKIVSIFAGLGLAGIAILVLTLEVVINWCSKWTFLVVCSTSLHNTT